MNDKLKTLINDCLMISMRQFEKESGVSRQTVYNLMHDKKKPSVLTVKKICDYFKVDFKDFIER